jgi:Tfp pilus assembly protein FimT
VTTRAVTLVELLLVLVLLGLLVAIGVPRLAAASDRAALRQARGTVLRALDAARGAAIRLGQPVELVASGGVLRIDTSSSAPAIWVQGTGDTHGVSWHGLVTPIRFGPSGIAVGVSNRTVQLGRGGDTLVVVVSRLGRIRW